MGRERAFHLERVGGGRRALVEEPGGAVAAAAAFLGPTGQGVDLLVDGAVAAEVRGAGLPDGAFVVRVASGERLVVSGRPPRLHVASDRRAPTAVLVADGRDGARTLTWSEDGAIAGVLGVFPAAGGEPWRLDVAGHVDWIRTTALLLAAERLVRAGERAAGPPALG